jgi:hypothetical protein
MMSASGGHPVYSPQNAGHDPGVVGSLIRASTYPPSKLYLVYVDTDPELNADALVRVAFSVSRPPATLTCPADAVDAELGIVHPGLAALHFAVFSVVPLNSSANTRR